MDKKAKKDQNASYFGPKATPKAPSQQQAIHGKKESPTNSPGQPSVRHFFGLICAGVAALAWYANQSGAAVNEGTLGFITQPIVGVIAALWAVMLAWDLALVPAILGVLVYLIMQIPSISIPVAIILGACIIGGCVIYGRWRW